MTIPLTEIIWPNCRELEKENYKIVSFEESLTDPIYQQKDFYCEKWGISWLYRCMRSSKQKYAWMSQAPDFVEIEKTYNVISKT